MAKARLDQHSKREFGTIMQRGLKALALARTHATLTEARLPAGTLDGLSADLVKLGADVLGALVTRALAVSATRSQNVSLARILSAADEVVSAGVLEFAKVAEVRGAFEALVVGDSGKGRGKKSAGKVEGSGEVGRCQPEGMGAGRR